MRQNWKGIGSYSAVGLEFALSILVGLFLGHWLDKKLDTGGWLTLIGAGFGLAAGARGIWRAAQRATREAERLEREEQEARAKFHDEHRDD